jgi:predicted dehydrogenase
MLKVGLSGYQIWYHGVGFAEELQSSKAVKIVSVFDENQRFAERLGEASGGAKVCTNIDAFIDSGFDFVIMTGLPSRKLSEVKKYAAAKKHILIDKPVSSTAKDAFEISEVCRKHGVKAMVGYNLHWAQALRQARDVLAEGKLGKPVYAFYAYDGPMMQETEWSKKPGWLMDPKENMSYWFIHVDHGIDILMWLLDAAYTDVYAQIQNVASPEYQSADWGVGLFTMDNGVKAVLKCDAITPPPFEILNIRIMCERGGLVFDYFPSSRLQVVGESLTGNKVWEYDFKDHWRQALARMAEEFAGYIVDDRPIPKYQSTEVAGYRVMATAEAAHRSNDSDQRVKIHYDL